MYSNIQALFIIDIHIRNFTALRSHTTSLCCILASVSPYFSDALEIFILAAQLQQGDHFPSLSFKLLNGGSLTLPEDITTRYAAVLFYRGHW